MEILDQYVDSIPCAQNALDIFEGEWSSSLPKDLQLKAGSTPLFEDDRISWCISQLGDITGFKLIELGPLEGGHTYMLEQAGASSILSIEANTRAYLKCLVTKEILKLEKSRFICGDFVKYLGQTQEHFDLSIASGVLYHMKNPAELISLLSKTADKVFLWTHYYDKEVIESDPTFSPKFPTSSSENHEGFQHTLHNYQYQAALDWKGFCGGSAPYSNWMSRSAILDCLKYFGFNRIEVNFDDRNHPNGPSFALLALK